MPDGKEILFYKIRTMPMDIAERYYQIQKQDNPPLAVLDQLSVLAPDADRDYLRRALNMETAGMLLDKLAEGLGIEKKDQPGPITKSPDSVGTD